jgi:hypothetical protein
LCVGQRSTRLSSRLRCSPVRSPTSSTVCRSRCPSLPSRPEWPGSYRTLTFTSFSGHPFRCAYMRRVMAVQAPRAAVSRVNGLGPASCPPFSGGSSATMRCGPITISCCKPPIDRIIVSNFISPSARIRYEARFPDLWLAGDCLSSPFKETFPSQRDLGS